MTGREYELLTNGGDGYISEVTAWTFMPNLWLDVPLHPPIAWIFGRIVRVASFSIPYPEKWVLPYDVR